MQVTCPNCDDLLETSSPPGSKARCGNCGSVFTLPSARPLPRRARQDFSAVNETPAHAGMSVGPVPWFYSFAKFVCYTSIVVGTLVNAAYFYVVVDGAARARQAGFGGVSTAGSVFVISTILFIVAELLVFFLPCGMLILIDIGEIQRRSVSRR